MATTLLDYKNSITAKGYEAVTTASAITAAVNAARRRIVNARRWTFLQVEDKTLVTSYGDNTVPISAAWRVDAIRSTQGTDSWDLEYSAPEELRRLALLDDTPGTPQYWTMYAGQVNLYPIPDGVYTLVVDYDKETLPLLAADSDVETMLEDTMIEVVAWAAAKDLSFRMRDYSATNFAEAEYQSHLLAAIRDDNTRNRQAAGHVATNPNRFEDR